MNALHSLVPSWLHRRNDDMPEDYEMPPLPTVAAIPTGVRGGYQPEAGGEKPAAPKTGSGVERPPAFSAQDEDKMIFGKAAVMLEQLKRDREAAIQREQELQVQLTEVVLARQGDVKKSDFLELENAELRNNIQTLQSDVENYRRFMSNVKQILDSFGIKAPEKKPRKAKTKQDSMPPVTA